MNIMSVNKFGHLFVDKERLENWKDVLSLLGDYSSMRIVI